jgi:hypothetical protein
LGAFGIAAIGVGSYFGIRAIQKRDESGALCPAERCSEEGARLSGEAVRDANYANVGIGLGLASAGVGTYLVLSAKRRAPEQAPRAGIVPRNGGATLSIQGAF